MKNKSKKESSSINFGGVVLHGKGRGKSLGYPTANLSNSKHQLSDGVYAGVSRIDNQTQKYLSVLSVGTNPSFDDINESVIEVHLIDYDGNDFYGETLSVCMSYPAIRGMVKFDNLDDLIKQINQDVEIAKKKFYNIDDVKII